MVSTLRNPHRVEPKVTEQYLLGLDDVVGASVMLRNGEMTAHVVVHENARLTDTTIRKLCLETLGRHQTPDHVFLVAVRSRAA